MPGSTRCCRCRTSSGARTCRPVRWRQAGETRRGPRSLGRGAQEARTWRQHSCADVSVNSSCVFRACNQALLASERDNVHAVTSLRRTEAAARSALLRPVSYSVRLELGDDPAGFASVSRIEFTAEAGSASFVDVHPLRLNGAVAQRHSARHRRGFRGRTTSAQRPARVERAGRRCGDGVLARRRGTRAPRRSGRWPHLPLRDVVPRRRTAVVRLLRPAGSEGSGHARGVLPGATGSWPATDRRCSRRREGGRSASLVLLRRT